MEIEYYKAENNVAYWAAMYKNGVVELYYVVAVYKHDFDPVSEDLIARCDFYDEELECNFEGVEFVNGVLFTTKQECMDYILGLMDGREEHMKAVHEVNMVDYLYKIQKMTAEYMEAYETYTKKAKEFKLSKAEFVAKYYPPTKANNET